MHAINPAHPSLSFRQSSSPSSAGSMAVRVVRTSERGIKASSSSSATSASAIAPRPPSTPKSCSPRAALVRPPRRANQSRKRASLIAPSMMRACAGVGPDDDPRLDGARQQTAREPIFAIASSSARAALARSRAAERTAVLRSTWSTLDRTRRIARRPRRRAPRLLSVCGYLLAPSLFASQSPTTLSRPRSRSPAVGPRSIDRRPPARQRARRRPRNLTSDLRSHPSSRSWLPVAHRNRLRRRASPSSARSAIRRHRCRRCRLTPSALSRRC